VSDSDFIEEMLRGQAASDQITAAIRDNAEHAEAVSASVAEAMFNAIVFLRSVGMGRAEIASFFAAMAYRVDEMQKAAEVLGGEGSS
jgi:hypothetical protein